jgi:hypothetical protein
MLHIITPAYRFENLERIYYSINANYDIRWHISKSNKREELKFDFIKNDKRVIVYNVECEDNEIYKKRNEVLSKINDGYFCFLDDDTLFHENMYIKYFECEQFNLKQMLVGQQIDAYDKLRLVASVPLYGHIDTGNVICYHSVLKEVRWPSEHIEGVNHKDFLFWNSVYEFYNKRCTIWNQPISYYNKLNTNK